MTQTTNVQTAFGFAPLLGVVGKLATLSRQQPGYTLMRFALALQVYLSPSDRRLSLNELAMDLDMDVARLRGDIKWICPDTSRKAQKSPLPWVRVQRKNGRTLHLAPAPPFTSLVTELGLLDKRACHHLIDVLVRCRHEGRGCQISTFSRLQTFLLLADAGTVGRTTFEMANLSGTDLLAHYRDTQALNQLYRGRPPMVVSKALSTTEQRHFLSNFGREVLNDMGLGSMQPQALSLNARPQYGNRLSELRQAQPRLHAPPATGKLGRLRSLFNALVREEDQEFFPTPLRIGLFLHIARNGNTPLSTRDLREQTGITNNRLGIELASMTPNAGTTPIAHPKPWLHRGKRTAEGYHYHLSARGQRLLEQMGLNTRQALDEAIECLDQLRQLEDRRFWFTAKRVAALLGIAHSTRTGLSSKQLMDLLEIYPGQLKRIVVNMTAPDEAGHTVPEHRRYLYREAHFGMHRYHLSDQGEALLGCLGLDRNPVPEAKWHYADTQESYNAS